MHSVNSAADSVARPHGITNDIELNMLGGSAEALGGLSTRQGFHPPSGCHQCYPCSLQEPNDSGWRVEQCLGCSPLVRHAHLPVHLMIATL
jgi:hypothetical protein